MAQGNFEIELRYGSAVSDAQRKAFNRAAMRWTACITDPLPAVEVQGEAVAGLRIDVQIRTIDGPHGVWARGGPIDLRPGNAGRAAFLPVTGIMMFDPEDLATLERDGLLHTVICHEMGHVLGIGGEVWTKKGLLSGAGTADPRFVGATAMHEYGVLRGSGSTPVPVENRYGPGFANVHWRKSEFGAELMSSFPESGVEALSRITLASLFDLGYAVDFAAADAYALPAGHEAHAKAIGATEDVSILKYRRRAPRPRVLANEALIQ